MALLWFFLILNSLAVLNSYFDSCSYSSKPFGDSGLVKTG